MVYVGERLPKLGQPYENENCLINPRLPVGHTGDPAGSSMGYWPSYAQITPQARKSYLDWLAGSRADPLAYIGYVFLYFYGLERRLMLEPNAPDAAAVLSEVRRLLSIYGGNGSFHRYASALISAYDVRNAKLPSELSLEVEENSYEVPMSLKVALGLQVGSDQPIPADLLLAYVVAHPETRVRTPARRAGQDLLKRMFTDELARKFPKGIKISGQNGRKLKLDYRACSGSFEVQIQPFGLDLIDVTQRSQPIESGRKVFETCMDHLDGYSRALGRSDGVRPTLSAVAKLPQAYRKTETELLSGRPLQRLQEMAAGGTATTLVEVASLAGMNTDKISSRAKLVELSSTLAAFGLGFTTDPAFSLRAPRIDEPVLVFPLVNEAREPSASYKSAQLSSVLGLLIATADGEVHDLELAALRDRVDKLDDISVDERVRLKAEIQIQAADPTKLVDYTRRLKDVSSDARDMIADAAIAVASADGTVHPKEVAQLEKLFRQMSLEPVSLYSRLHGHAISAEPNGVKSDDDPPLVIPPSQGAIQAAIPSPPGSQRSAFRVDRSRLDTIRQETRMASGVLADIFADEEDVEITAPVPADPPSEDDLFEGLERRYGLLLVELRAREEWSAAEFDRLIREAGLMPAAAKEVLNDWSLDTFDELLVEGDDPVIINLHVLPAMTDAHITRTTEERLTT